MARRVRAAVARLHPEAQHVAVKPQARLQAAGNDGEMIHRLNWQRLGHDGMLLAILVLLLRLAPPSTTGQRHASITVAISISELLSRCERSGRADFLDYAESAGR